MESLYEDSGAQRKIVKNYNGIYSNKLIATKKYPQVTNAC